MPDRIVQPNPGHLAGIADEIVRAEIRKLWELVHMRAGQIGNRDDRYVTAADLEALRRQIPDVSKQSTGYRATTLGGEGGGGEPAPAGGGAVASYDEGVLLTPATGAYDFRGSAITAQQFGDITRVTVDTALSGSQAVQFFADSSFTVPEGVYLLWLSMLAGGGGGGSRNTAAGGSGGGGSGEVCIDFPVFVTPGDVYTITIGGGGAGAVGAGANVNGADGGDTSFGQFKVKGGRGAPAATPSSNGGNGGGSVPGLGSGSVGNVGSPESNAHFGGNGGSGGGVTTGANGSPGLPGPGFNVGSAGGSTAGSQAGGGGGAGTLWGIGGAGGNGGMAGGDAPAGSYGAGGGGAGGKAGTGMNGGSGRSGWCLVAWIGSPLA